MRKEVVKSKTGVMIRRTSTLKEREEAKKRLFEMLDEVYKKHQKINH